MGVDLQVGRFVAVAGDVDVTDARRGQRTQEFVRVVAVVGGVDDDVVDVQQQVAVGLGEHRVDEVDLVHRLEGRGRSEEHTSELQSLMRISYAVFCLKKKKTDNQTK